MSLAGRVGGPDRSVPMATTEAGKPSAARRGSRIEQVSLDTALGGGARQEPESGFRGPQVCKIVGISYRQLDYWARTDLVTPSLQPAQGSGSQRLYAFEDLVRLKLI